MIQTNISVKHNQTHRHKEQICVCQRVGGGGRRQWHPTPVLLPGKSHGRRSLVGYSPWGHKESDTTEWLRCHCQCLFLKKYHCLDPQPAKIEAVMISNVLVKRGPLSTFKAHSYEWVSQAGTLSFLRLPYLPKSLKTFLYLISRNF